MLILRRLAPFSQHHFNFIDRFYATKPIANMIQVHQETLRYINPHANIKIDSDIDVKVSSADPHKYPNGDALIAELRGGPVKNCTASMVVKVSDDERNVEVTLKRLTESSDFHCVIAVPIKSAIDICSQKGAVVKNTYGDALKIKAVKYIKTENIRAECIQLLSEGDINCRGTLLGKETSIEAKNKGNIILDKLQGDSLTCRTSQGNITTNCSYVESSKFETDTGCLNLQNVHKKAEVFIHQKGDLKMTGVHGNLKVVAKGGAIDLQLSELHGESIIETQDLASSTINISDDIEKNTLVEVGLMEKDNKYTIMLDSTLEHLSAGLTENKQKFQWPLNQEQTNKLRIASRNSLTLGKSSWMNMMRLKMEKKNHKA